MHRGPRTKYDRELAAQGVGNTHLRPARRAADDGRHRALGRQRGSRRRTRASAILHGVWLLLFVSVIPFSLRYIPTSALAAILVYTGYKLVYPKVVPKLLQFGKSEVFIYVVTIVMIVLTNLLEGVLVGLALVAPQAALRLLASGGAQGGDAGRTTASTSISKARRRSFGCRSWRPSSRSLKPGADVHVHVDRARLHRPRLPRPVDQLGPPVQWHRRHAHDRVGRADEEVPPAARSQREGRAAGEGVAT